MKRKWMALLPLALAVSLFALPTLAETELFPYMTDNINHMMDAFDLYEDGSVAMGGDGLEGIRYANMYPGLEFWADMDGDVFSASVTAGGGQYSLMGVRLGMRAEEAEDIAKAYLESNGVDYYYEPGVWYEIDNLRVSYTVDNGVVTAMESFYL